MTHQKNVKKNFRVFWILKMLKTNSRTTGVKAEGGGGEQSTPQQSIWGQGHQLPW